MDRMTVSMLLDVTMGPPGEKLITWKREKRGYKKECKGRCVRYGSQVPGVVTETVVVQ